MELFWMCVGTLSLMLLAFATVALWKIAARLRRIGLMLNDWMAQLCFVLIGLTDTISKHVERRD